MTSIRNQWVNRAVCILLTALMIMVSGGFDNAWGASLSHDVKFSIRGDGQLYFNLGPKLEACHIDSPKDMSSACCVESGKTYTLSKVINRGVIAVPGENSLFEGFYDGNGRKVNLKAVKMDILRVKVGGTYVYTHYPSFGEGAATSLTKPLYGEVVKKYVKTLYNTSSYSVKGQETVYILPDKKVTLTARFRDKAVPKLSLPESIQKTFGDCDFAILKNFPDGLTVKCSSSSSKILSVNKTTGTASIKGTGIAKVTVKTPATDFYQSTEKRIKVYVNPAAPSNLSAAKKTSGSICVNWSSVGGCSGYEIEFSPTQSFSKIVIKGKSAKSTSDTKTFKLKENDYTSCKYVRIRGYKKSCGETLYSSYINARVK